jgi:TATA element modulatory factor
MSGNASSTEEPETCASSDIEVLSLPSNSGDQLLASINVNGKSIQRIPSLASMAASASAGLPNATDKKSTASSSQKVSLLSAKKQGATSAGAASNSNVMQMLVKSPPPLPPLPPPSSSSLVFSSSPSSATVVEQPLNSFSTTTNSTNANALLNAASIPSELKSLLEAREAHILKLNKQHVKLQEDNDNLISELEKLKYEHNERVKQLEDSLLELKSKNEHSINDKEQIKKVCSDLQREILDVKSMLREKEQQIEQLTQEGLKLSKQELNQSNIIKKLRAKEKDNEELMNQLK